MTQASGQKRVGRHSWPRVTQRGEFLVEGGGGCATWASQGPSESRLGAQILWGLREPRRPGNKLKSMTTKPGITELAPLSMGDPLSPHLLGVQEKTQVRYFSLLRISHTMEKTICLGQSDNTTGRVFTLHRADLVSIPGVPFSLQTLPGMIPEYQQMWPQIKQLKAMLLTSQRPTRAHRSHPPQDPRTQDPKSLRCPQWPLHSP